MIGHLTRSLSALVAFALAFSATAAPQAVHFSEDFENIGFVPIGGWGPQGLINDGWIFINNGQPQGSIGWYAGAQQGSLIIPLSGQTYLAADQSSAAGAPAQYSLWAILPPIPNQQQGDILTFYTISTDTSSFENVSLQARYSPTGGANPGNTATSVGDFTSILVDIPTVPNYNSGLYDGWTKWEVTLPGPGRIALRQYGSQSLFVGVEDISVRDPDPASGPLPEDFEDLGGVCGEGPCALINNAWAFVDQGSLSAGPAWQPPFAGDIFQAHSGVSFIKSSKGGGAGGSVNTFAILPDTTFQSGDVLSFWVRGSISDGGVFELRHSPTGSISTGTGGTGVGSFTNALLQMTVLPFDAWQHVAVTLPGPGRYALRLHDPFHPGFDPAIIAAVDTMELNPAPAAVPLPGPGETVTWTLAMSPITINADMFIPPGGTVVVDPGVEIVAVDQHTLAVGGTLIAHGTETAPITITGNDTFFAPPVLVPGTADLQFVHVTGRILGQGGGSILVADSQFESGFVSTEDTIGNPGPQYVQVERSTFNAGGISVVDGQLVVRDSTFFNASVSVLRGFIFIDNVDITNGVLSVDRHRDPQSIYINNVHVNGATTGGGLQLHNWNFLLGPDNVLTGNLYPVQLAGGLLPGSIVPVSGNINNYVLREDYIALDNGRSIMAPIAVPYVISGVLEGPLTILPGAVLRFLPNSSLLDLAGVSIDMEGLPQSPITLQPHAGQWDGIFFNTSRTAPKIEHCIVEGANLGVVAVDTRVAVENCILQNNNVGSNSNSFGSCIIRKSQILNNAIGVQGTQQGTPNLLGETNPNSIAGNGQGVTDPGGATLDARFNWWGHPSGPTSPFNPGGQGDSIGGGSLILFAPFRTTPPDFGDTPPVVRMTEPFFYAEAGDTLVLQWEASDNGAIVSQRVLFAEHWELPNVVLADNLPGDQRSLKFTVPVAQPSSNNSGSFLRIEAVDDAGQIGIDQTVFFIPFDFDGGSTFAITDQPAPGEVFTPGEEITFSYAGGDSTVTASLIVDSTGDAVSLGGGAAQEGTITFKAPFISTDMARIAVSGDAELVFTDFFSIRPDARIGDQPPTIQMLSPSGESFEGGSDVNISWSASDDEGVRSINILASYDGEKTWQFIAKDLPGTTTSYTWHLPPSAEPISAKIRVVAFDLRFQASSSDQASPVFGDLTGDGVVGPADLAQLLSQWGKCSSPPPGCAADLNHDGAIGPADLAQLLAQWG